MARFQSHLARVNSQPGSFAAPPAAADKSLQIDAGSCMGRASQGTARRFIEESRRGPFTTERNQPAIGMEVNRNTPDGGSTSTSFLRGV